MKRYRWRKGSEGEWLREDALSKFGNETTFKIFVTSRTKAMTLYGNSYYCKKVYYKCFEEEDMISKFKFYSCYLGFAGYDTLWRSFCRRISLALLRCFQINKTEIDLFWEFAIHN